MGTCVSAFMCVACAFSLALFLLFVLYYSNWFVLFFFYCTFYHYPLDAFLFSNKTERGRLWMGGEVGKNLEERGGELEYIV